MNRGSLLKTLNRRHVALYPLNQSTGGAVTTRWKGAWEDLWGRTFTCQQAQERYTSNSRAGSEERTRKEVWGANRLQRWGKELRQSRGKIKAKKIGWPKGDGSILLFLCTPAYPDDVYGVFSTVARMPFSSLFGSLARMWHVLETFVIIFVSSFVSSANLHFLIFVQIAVTDLFFKEPSFA